MDEANRDGLIRIAAFEHVRSLGEVHDHLTATELTRASFSRTSAFRSAAGIFKPQQMRFASGELIVRWQSWTRVPRFGPAFRMGESMEGDDQKLERLKQIAGKHGYDIVLLPER